jgi:pSer/pThr/pTyr-binding forkhead associated (FHA) protein
MAPTVVSLGIALIALVLTVGAQGTTRATRITEDVFTRCAQLDVTTIECDYRQIQPQALEQISARLGELELPTPEVYEFPQPGSVGAVLFLIDTSDPNRRTAVRAGVAHVEQMLATAAGHHVFGVATFDSSLRVIAELGSSIDALKQALGEVRAGGRTTEMYRNSLAAIRLLSEFNADRKALVLLSDGLAEDRAYFHADVVAEARKHGITIDGLGYPRSVALSVGLQTLRRLAEETGGRYVEGDVRYRLDATYLAAPFASLDDGGEMIVDAGPALDAGATGVVELLLEWRREGSVARLSMPIKLPDPLPPPAPDVAAPAPQIVYVQTPPVDLPENATVIQAPVATIAATRPNNSEPASSGMDVTATSGGTEANAGAGAPSAADSSVRTPASAEAASDGVETLTSTDTSESSADNGKQSSPPTPGAFETNQFSRVGPLAVGSMRVDLPDTVQQWFWAIVAGIVMGVLLIIRLMVRATRKRRAEAHTVSAAALALTVAAEDEERRTYAFLESLSDGQRYPITSAAFRIGRHADNELPLHDASISRHHGQIHRKRDGTFTVSDLESMNGVFVNDKRVTTGAALREGDSLELGDVKMRFTMLSADPLAGEETVVVRTVAPGKFGTAAQREQLTDSEVATLSWTAVESNLNHILFTVSNIRQYVLLIMRSRAVGRLNRARCSFSRTASFESYIETLAAAGGNNRHRSCCLVGRRATPSANKLASYGGNSWPACYE